MKHCFKIQAVEIPPYGLKRVEAVRENFKCSKTNRKGLVNMEKRKDLFTISVYELYEKFGSDLTYGRIEVEEGEDFDYYDLINEHGRLAVLDGETCIQREAEVLGGGVIAVNFEVLDTGERFRLSPTEFATGMMYQKHYS